MSTSWCGRANVLPPEAACAVRIFFLARSRTTNGRGGDIDTWIITYASSAFDGRQRVVALRLKPRRVWLKVRDRAASRLASWRDRLLRLGREGRAVTSLEQVHRRLELFLTALYGRTISIAPFDRRGTLLSRGTARRRLLRILSGRMLSSAEGDSIFLPPALADRDDVPALMRYRLLALEQAERIVRGTTSVPLPSDPLERDLFFLREGMTIDARIARTHRGLGELLARERVAALARRPKLDRLTDAERAVELRMREMLASPPGDVDAESQDADASMAWARETAQTIRASNGGHASRAAYRGLPLAAIWGEQRESNAAKAAGNERDELDAQRKSRRREKRQHETQEAPPADASNADQRQDSSVNERGDPKADARTQQQPEYESGSLTGAPATLPRGGAAEDLPPPILYDEWNTTRGAYDRRAVSVRVHDSPSGDDAWARAAAVQYAPTVRRIRHQFERLRARRTLIKRQRDGTELDIDAYVDSALDRHVGLPLDERLYIEVRPARRGVAIALLIDASQSTDRRLGDGQRIIDVERVALYLASEALDALGDMFAVYSFGGQGAQNVKLSVVKSFGERNGPAVHERIGAVEPEGFTRLGATIRHATAQLARQSAGHRLLLLLSDGRPHDVDHYQEEFAIDDARQAIFEARASGVFPYCLAVDIEAPEYLARIFGGAGHTILRRPEHLPNALISVVNGLLARAS